MVRATHVTRPPVRPLVAAALMLAGFCSAASAQTLSLSPDEKAQVLAGNTEASVDAARAGYSDTDLGGAKARGIHGEIGAMIGSNGARGAFGAASIPLGRDASAQVYFEDTHYGHPR